MSQSRSMILLGFVCMMAARPQILCQTDDERIGNSFGVRAGYSFSFGDWARARVAPDVRLFKGSIVFGADLEFGVSRRLAIAVEGGYAPLDPGEWESLARTRGSNLNISASFVHVAILLRPYLKISQPDLIRIELGPVAVFPSGRETVGGKTYEYAFFESARIGGEGGIAYERLVGESVAVSLRAALIVIPSGVTYADGFSYTMIALPVTVGVRFLF